MSSTEVAKRRSDPRLPSIETLDVDEATVSNLENFMQRVFGPGSEAIGSLTAQLGTLSALPRDYETAYGLMRRAAEAFPAALARCERLEADLRDVRSQAASEVAAAREVAAQWNHLAVALKGKLEETEGQVATLEKRLSAAENSAAAGRRQADDAEQQARVAMEITTLFHDKIVEAFGVGSPAHAALDRLAAMPQRPGEPA